MPSSAEPNESHRVLFKAWDWWAALVTTLISGFFFYYHMAPEVTLQDSGELVTGAFTFGVPHPPGYPLWALLGFIWSHFIVPFGNPAWRIGLLSVVTGAAVVGVMTLTMTRSLRLLLHSAPWARQEDEGLYQWIALIVGASTAILFGFNRGVWLWACVSEMRVLNVFSFVLISCMFFIWAVQPHRRGFLYATLLLFAGSLANHQTVAVMAAPIAVGVFVVGLDLFFALGPRIRERWFPALMRSLAAFWELTGGGLLSLMVGMFIFGWLQNSVPGDRPGDFTMKMGMLAGFLGGLCILVGRITGWWQVKRSLVAGGLLLFGISFYLYMAVAASTNPPMNWGFASTTQGFLHAITRGQYEQLKTASLFSDEFFLKVIVFVKALAGQYSFGLSLLGIIPLAALIAYWRRWSPRGRSWMIYVWVAFLATSLGLLTIINPKLDRQEQEITIKFFAPAHGFFAMLIGYGIAMVFTLVVSQGPKWAGWPVRLLCVATLALPLITYQKNWPLCALRGHDFGYLFGYLMFNPGGDYPPMERGAVLYGGTDPGRFVPTYMIFCESRVAPADRFRDKNFDRSDVYIITQNALADATYMSYIRDHYDFSRPNLDKPETLQKFLPWQRFVYSLGCKFLGRDRVYPPEPIHIPSPDESNRGFQEYIRDVQTGKIPASADIKIQNGRLIVNGVGGVMAINGVLAKQIFERNKDKHAFYVEESYVIPWMYPYLRPAGVIMKIEKEPLPAPAEDQGLWKEIVDRDRVYWDKLTARFLARPEFVRNLDAKKSFSKMRVAIAGLYVARGLLSEAEYAFRQSLQLCPESPESNFRLAEFYMRLGRFEEARNLILEYQKLDIYNANIDTILKHIDLVEKNALRG
jgi:hypothetical protein